MNTPERRSFSRAWLVFFVAMLVIVPIAGHLAELDTISFVFSTWSDRDLHREVRMDVTPQVMGPEITGIGRTPGGFYYTLLRGLTRFGSDPEVVFRGSVALSAIAIVLLAFATHRYVGKREALVVLAASICIDTQIFAHTLNLWNPAFVFLFIAAGYAVFLHVLARGDDSALPLLSLTVGLGAQLHISLYSLLVMQVVATWAVLGRIRARTLALTLLGLGIVLGPYLWSEVTTGFPNLRLLTLIRAPDDGPPLLLSGVFGWLAAVFGLDVVTQMAPDVSLPTRIFASVATSCLFLITAAHFGPRLVADVRRALRREPRPPLDAAARIEWGLLFVALVGLVVQRAGAIYETIMMRHYLILIPAGMVLSARALVARIDRIDAQPSFGSRATRQLLLMGWLASASFANLAAGRFAFRELYPRWGMLTYADLAQLRRGAVRSVHVEDDAIPMSTLILRERPDDVDPSERRPSGAAGRFAPLDSNLHIAWPTYRTPSSDGQAPLDRCLAILIRDAPTRGARPPLASEDVVAALRAIDFPWRVPPRVRAVAARAAVTYATFDTVDGNCPRSLAHPYNPSVPEEQLERARSSILRSGVVALAPRFYGVRLGRLTHGAHAGVRLEGGRTLDGRPGLRATLYGAALRGNGGTQSHRLLRPRVVFTSRATGVSTEIVIGDGSVGGAHSTSATPFHSPFVHVPPGAYRVRLRARYDATYRYGGSEWTFVERELDDAFVVD